MIADCYTSTTAVDRVNQLAVREHREGGRDRRGMKKRKNISMPLVGMHSRGIMIKRPLREKRRCMRLHIDSSFWKIRRDDADIRTPHARVCCTGKTGDLINSRTTRESHSGRHVMQ